jgi:DNA-binding response OmpR family regulator
VIVDVNLPGEHSGWEIMRRLSDQDRSRVKVIVTSAAPISEKRIGEFRPAHTLQKPFPIDALVRAIEDGYAPEATAPTKAAGNGRS